MKRTFRSTLTVLMGLFMALAFISPEIIYPQKDKKQKKSLAFNEKFVNIDEQEAMIVVKRKQKATRGWEGDLQNGYSLKSCYPMPFPKAPDTTKSEVKF